MKITHIMLALLCFIILFNLGQAIATTPFKVTIILTIGFIFSVLTIINLEIGLYLLIFVVPFTQQITLGKFARSPVDVGTDDVLIIFILLSWLAGLARRKEPLILKSPLNWPIAAFFAACVFSFIGAYTRFGTQVVLIGFLHLFKFFEYVVVYFIVISAIDNFEQIRKFLLMFFIVVGLVIIFQFAAVFTFGHFSLITPPPGLLYELTVHPFMTNATMGIYYCFFLSILLAIILYMPASKLKIHLSLFAVILSFALFNTFSRSAYVGLGASFLILSMLKEKRLYLVLLLLLIFSPIYMQSAVLERITITIRSFRPIILDASSAIRIVLWKKAMQVFLSSPFFGMGYWATRYALGGYEAHNQFLVYLVDIGIVGFSVFCWLMVRMFRNAATLLRKADTDFLKALALGYTAGLTAILANCFTTEPLDAFRMLGPLWFVTGLITSANRLLSGKTEVRPDMSSP